MRTAVGVFTDRSAAEAAVVQLEQLGFPPDRITVLSPGEPSSLTSVPTSEAEAPGIGKAVGAAVGTAVGAAAGLPIGAALATVFVPGIGPVIAAGVLGAAVLGAAGAAAGGALETHLTEGLPKDETFVYLDAVGRGRVVVIALADDEAHAEVARGALETAGAESLDAAREQWWLGLRSAEREQYVAAGHDFDADERAYRRGFEAALGLDRRIRSYDEAKDTLRHLASDVREREAFRRGVERGLTHRDLMLDPARREAA